LALVVSVTEGISRTAIAVAVGAGLGGQVGADRVALPDVSVGVRVGAAIVIGLVAAAAGLAMAVMVAVGDGVAVVASGCVVVIAAADEVAVFVLLRLRGQRDGTIPGALWLYLGAIVSAILSVVIAASVLYGGR
jgi:hypothetical protein